MNKFIVSGDNNVRDVMWNGNVTSVASDVVENPKGTSNLEI